MCCTQCECLFAFTFKNRYECLDSEGIIENSEKLNVQSIRNALWRGKVEITYDTLRRFLGNEQFLECFLKFEYEKLENNFFVELL